MRSVSLAGVGLALVGFILIAHPAAAQAPVPSGTIITIAGSGMIGFSGDGGPATSASLSGPWGLAIGPDVAAYVSDAFNFRIRRVDPVTGFISTVAGVGPPPGGFLDEGPNGDGGLATSAQIGDASSIAIDRARNRLYLAPISLNRVRKIEFSTGIIENFAGIGLTGGFGFSGDDGPAGSAQLAFPQAVAVDGTGKVSIADAHNQRIRRVDPVTGIITTIAGNGIWQGSPGDGGPATSASVTFPFLVAADAVGNVWAVEAPSIPTEHVVRRIDAASGIISTAAGGGANLPGNGLATDVHLDNVNAIAVDNAGSLYVANLNQILRVDLASGQMSLFAGTATPGVGGDGGPALDAQFTTITGLAAVPGGGLLVSDSGNNRVRYIAPDSINLSGDAGQTEFHLPWVSALAGDFVVSNNPNLTTIDAGGLASAGGSVTIVGNTGATVVDISQLASVGGSIEVGGNAAASTVDVSELASVGGNVTIVGNTGATVVDISQLASVGGSIEVGGNAAASTVDVSELASVGGNVTIVGNTGATVVDISQLASVGGSIEVGGNAAASTVDVSELASVGGNVTIVGNTGATVVDISQLASVGGSIEVGGNAAASTVDVSELASVGGNVTIVGNTGTTVVDISQLASVGGSIEVGGNAAASTVDVSELASVGGDVTITENGGATVVDLSSLASVGGSVNVETSGTGTFGISGADVGGDTNLAATGYTKIEAATAAGQTALTMFNSAATMEVVLPAGTFPAGDRVAFSVERLAPDPTDTWGQNPLTTLVAYQFTFENPMLGRDATLNFQIDLAALDSVARSALLDLLHSDLLFTLAVQGDDPGAALQLFEVCGPGLDPIVDECVRVLWLDALGAVLDPLGGVDPAVLRFEALVGHFSTYSIVAVVPEPGALALVALGLPWIAWRRWRNRAMVGQARRA